MPPDAPLSDPSLTEMPFLLMLLIGTAAIGSLCVWASIANRWRRGADLLPYEPRRQVPWTLLDVSLMFLIALVSLTVVPLAAGVDLDTLSTEMSSQDAALLMTSDGVAKLLFVLLSVAVLSTST